MKKYLVLLCFYYLPVTAQEHKTLKEKDGNEAKVKKGKGKSSDKELMREEEKTVQELKRTTATSIS